MLKASSALASAKPYVSNQLTITEAPDFTLTQYAGADKDLKKALGKLPARVGIVQDNLLRVAPDQIWALHSLSRHSREGGNPSSSSEPKLDSRLRGNDGGGGVFITELSSSRTRIEISGAPARDLLAKCAAIDFHKSEFMPNSFAMTGMHHVPVLIRCVTGDTFHIYVMRTFALSIWDHITDAALEYA
jgi:heterotetrameric sarcosine oxidase gamma subunit